MILPGKRRFELPFFFPWAFLPAILLEALLASSGWFFFGPVVLF